MKLKKSTSLKNCLAVMCTALATILTVISDQDEKVLEIARQVVRILEITTADNYAENFQEEQDE